MACLRKQAPDGRIGTVSCDEEGCVFTRVSTSSRASSVTETPETDCLLQLRLRTGDTPEGALTATGRIMDPTGGPHFVDVEFELSVAQYNLLRDHSAEYGISTDARVTKIDPSRWGAGDYEAVGERMYYPGIDHGVLYVRPDDTIETGTLDEQKPLSQQRSDEGRADGPIYRKPGKYPWAADFGTGGNFMVLGHDAGKSALRRQDDDTQEALDFFKRKRDVDAVVEEANKIHFTDERPGFEDFDIDRNRVVMPDLTQPYYQRLFGGTAMDESIGKVVSYSENATGVTATVRLNTGWTVERIEEKLRQFFWGGPDDFDLNESPGLSELDKRRIDREVSEMSEEELLAERDRYRGDRAESERAAIVVDGLPVPEHSLYGIKNFRWGLHRTKTEGEPMPARDEHNREPASERSRKWDRAELNELIREAIHEYVEQVESIREQLRGVQGHVHNLNEGKIEPFEPTFPTDPDAELRESIHEFGLDGARAQREQADRSGGTDQSGREAGIVDWNRVEHVKVFHNGYWLIIEPGNVVVQLRKD